MRQRYADGRACDQSSDHTDASNEAAADVEANLEKSRADATTLQQEIERLQDVIQSELCGNKNSGAPGHRRDVVEPVQCSLVDFHTGPNAARRSA